MHSLYFRVLQLITISFLINYMSWSTRFVKAFVGFSIFNSVSFLLKFNFLLNPLSASVATSSYDVLLSYFSFCRQVIANADPWRCSEKWLSIKTVKLKREKPNKTEKLRSFLGFSAVFRKVLQKQIRTSGYKNP